MGANIKVAPNTGLIYAGPRAPISDSSNGSKGMKCTSAATSYHNASQYQSSSPAPPGPLTVAAHQDTTYKTKVARLPSHTARVSLSILPRVAKTKWRDGPRTPCVCQLSPQAARQRRHSHVDQKPGHFAEGKPVPRQHGES